MNIDSNTYVVVVIILLLISTVCTTKVMLENTICYVHTHYRVLLLLVRFTLLHGAFGRIIADQMNPQTVKMMLGPFY